MPNPAFVLAVSVCGESEKPNNQRRNSHSALCKVLSVRELQTHYISLLSLRQTQNANMEFLSQRIIGLGSLWLCANIG